MLIKHFAAHNLLSMYTNVLEYLTLMESPIESLLFLMVSAKEGRITYDTRTIRFESAEIVLYQDNDMVIVADTKKKTLHCNLAGHSLASLKLSCCEFIESVLQEYLFFMHENDDLVPIRTSGTSATVELVFYDL